MLSDPDIHHALPAPPPLSPNIAEGHAELVLVILICIPILGYIESIKAWIFELDQVRSENLTT